MLPSSELIKIILDFQI